MVLSQTIMPAQVMPNIWGPWQGIIEGLSLLGPTTCPVSWLVSLVEWVDVEPAKRTSPVLPTTPPKPNTPAKSDKGKSSSGSSIKQSGLPKQIFDYWKDPEKRREDKQS